MVPRPNLFEEFQQQRQRTARNISAISMLTQLYCERALQRQEQAFLLAQSEHDNGSEQNTP